MPGTYEYWNTFAAGAMIAPGDVYIVAHGSASPDILAQADETMNYLSNGDDGFMLVQGTEADFVILDVIGDWEGDPGSGWEVAGYPTVQNHTLVRKRDVTTGGVRLGSGCWYERRRLQWIVLDIDVWANLGGHDFTGNRGAAIGCTNENATNYDPSATEDDGSCMFDNACNVDGVVVAAGSYYFSPTDLSIEPGHSRLGKRRWFAQRERYHGYPDR